MDNPIVLFKAAARCLQEDTIRPVNIRKIKILKEILSQLACFLKMIENWLNFFFIL